MQKEYGIEGGIIADVRASEACADEESATPGWRVCKQRIGGGPIQLDPGVAPWTREEAQAFADETAPNFPEHVLWVQPDWGDDPKPAPPHVTMEQFRAGRWQVISRQKGTTEMHASQGIFTREVAEAKAADMAASGNGREYWIAPAAPYQERVLGFVNTCHFFEETGTGIQVVRAIGPDLAIGACRFPARDAQCLIGMLAEHFR